MLLLFFDKIIHSCSFPVRADWQNPDSSSRLGATGELEVEFKFRDVLASSPSFSRPAARAPRRACSQAKTPSHIASSLAENQLWSV